MVAIEDLLVLKLNELNGTLDGVDGYYPGISNCKVNLGNIGLVRNTWIFPILERTLDTQIDTHFEYDSSTVDIEEGHDFKSLKLTASTLNSEHIRGRFESKPKQPLLESMGIEFLSKEQTINFSPKSIRVYFQTHNNLFSSLDEEFEELIPKPRFSYGFDFRDRLWAPTIQGSVSAQIDDIMKKSRGYTNEDYAIAQLQLNPRFYEAKQIEAQVIKHIYNAVFKDLE